MTMRPPRAGRAAIILAGGSSARFGSDKLSAILDGRPLLEHALRAVDQVCATVVLVVGPDAPARPMPELRARLLVAHDAEARQGPLAGLAAGLAELAASEPSIDRAVLVGGDMPTLVLAVLERLLDTLDAQPELGVVLLEAEPMEPLPMAVRPSLVGPAAGSLLAEERRALRGLLARVPSAVIPAVEWRALDPDGRTLRDVDRPDDLADRRAPGANSREP